MNKKGLFVLQALVDNGYSNYVGYVVSSKDPGLIDDSYNDILDLCNNNKINFSDRKNKMLPLVDYKLAIGWRWLISEYENLIVLHDSILPRYRGFAPLVNSLINGEKEIGVTALWADQDYDQGDIIVQQKEQINYPIKIQVAIQKISKLYTNIVLEIFSKVRSNEKLISKPQEESEATYSIWRDQDDYKINWTQPADYIKRFIDAVGYPYQGAQSEIVGGESIIIDDALVLNDLTLELRHPGKIIRLNDGSPVVICGRGLIQLNKVRKLDGEEIKLTKLRTRFNIH